MSHDHDHDHDQNRTQDQDVHEGQKEGCCDIERGGAAAQPPAAIATDGFAVLAQRYLDGVATDDEADRLDAVLQADPAARDEYLRMVDLHASLADERMWVPRSDPLAAIVREELAAVDRSSHRRYGRAAAVAWLSLGLAFGALGAVLAAEFGLPLLAWRMVLLDEGFEAGIDPESKGFPRSTDLWAGDFSRCVAGEQGVTPHAGAAMLQLLRADYEGKATGGSTADVFRIVDVRPYRNQIATGRISLRAAARFNAAFFPDAERYAFATTLYALGPEAAGGSLATGAFDIAILDDALAFSQNGRVSLDRDPATWQPSECGLRLPANTAFVVVRLWVMHGTAAQRRETFPGHFIDSVELTLGDQSPQAP